MRITSYISRAVKLGDELSILNIFNELEDLQSDVEEERDNIEPYENRDDLTQQQEEKYEKLDNLASELEDILDVLREQIDRLTDIECNL